MIDHGIEGGILVIGRAAKLDAGVALAGYLLFRLLYQPRFTNPRLAAEQDYLAFPFFHSLPTFHQQPDLLLSAHQRRQPGRGYDLKAALRASLSQDLVDRDRGGNPLERVRSKILACKVPLDE